MFSGSARSNSQIRLITNTSPRTSALFRRIISKFCMTIWSGRKFYGGITRCWSKEKREYRYWGVSSITREKRIPNDLKPTQIQALFFWEILPGEVCLIDAKPSFPYFPHWESQLNWNLTTMVSIMVKYGLDLTPILREIFPLSISAFMMDKAGFYIQMGKSRDCPPSELKRWQFYASWALRRLQRVAFFEYRTIALWVTNQLSLFFRIVPVVGSSKSRGNTVMFWRIKTVGVDARHDFCAQ